MSLESATYVNQLVISNPDGADPKGQGDDHLRLIKTTLKNTFPNINGAVTVTPAEINALAGGTALFKTSMIVLWAGAIANIPTGWVLCNGTAGTPDLRDRFIVGAGSTYAVGSNGGAINHSHTISVAGTGLTIEQMPAHTHGLPSDASGSFDIQSLVHSNNADEGYAGIQTQSAGSGAPHTHTASSSTVDHRPPYYALAYIMKT